MKRAEWIVLGGLLAGAVAGAGAETITFTAAVTIDPHQEDSYPPITGVFTETFSVDESLLPYDGLPVPITDVLQTLRLSNGEYLSGTGGGGNFTNTYDPAILGILAGAGPLYSEVGVAADFTGSGLILAYDADEWRGSAFVSDGYYNYNLDRDVEAHVVTAETPEPASWVLLLTGASGVLVRSVGPRLRRAPGR